MSLIQRSFFYTLALYIFFAALWYLIDITTQQEEVVRHKVDPSQFQFKQISQKNTPKTVQKHQNANKQPTTQTSTYPKPETLKPFDPELLSKPMKEKTSPVPDPSKSQKKAPKSIELPKQDDLISSIFDNLPKPDKSQSKSSHSDEMLQELYGEHYTSLSTEAKTYLEDNHLIMQAITQKVLNRIGRVYLDPRFYYYDYNFVEFILYPDGSISDIKMLRDSGFKLLDKITKETIETAYKDYPYPKEPTLIRYKFLYDLRGY